MEHDQLRLSYHARYDWPAALTFLAHRAIDGVEQVESDTYRRTIRFDGSTGTLEIAHDDVGAALLATVRGLPTAAIPAATERVRRMFDLDADLRSIAAHLARDPSMAPLVAAAP